MTVKSSISLSDAQHAFVRAQVRAGRFASVSAAVQQGLDLLRQKAEAEELEHAALRALLAERQAGPFVPAGEMRGRVAALVAGKRGAHGLED